MSSMRDAMRRLDIIYQACAPEAIEEALALKGLDEFNRTKKKVNKDTKDIRRALKERETLLQKSGQSAETAEAGYQIRMLIKSVKTDIDRMEYLHGREEKKKGKKRLPEEELVVRKEVIQLCKAHVEEIEELEKRKFLEKIGADRDELIDGSGSGGGSNNNKSTIRKGFGHNRQESGTRKALFEGASNKKKGLNDPFKSKLADIDPEVAEDFQTMNEKNQIIDQDLKDIGDGVAQLREIALGMGQELDNQNHQLRDLEKNVDQVLDKVDNINIQLKNVVDNLMSGDRFMVNCVLMCIILALVTFIASIFTD